MNTALQQAAATAWAEMTRTRSKIQMMVDQMAGERHHPMDLGIALDYVQNVCDDRDDAVTALVNAGADWLIDQAPTDEPGPLFVQCAADAGMVIAHIRGQMFEVAGVFVNHAVNRCYAAHREGRDYWPAHWWLKWTDKAEKTLEWCKRVATAAYPAAYT